MVVLTIRWHHEMENFKTSMWQELALVIHNARHPLKASKKKKKKKGHIYTAFLLCIYIYIYTIYFLSLIFKSHTSCNTK